MTREREKKWKSIYEDGKKSQALSSPYAGDSYFKSTQWPSMGSHRVGHDWSDLAAEAVTFHTQTRVTRCFSRTALQRLQIAGSRTVVFLFFELACWCFHRNYENHDFSFSSEVFISGPCSFSLKDLIIIWFNRNLIARCRWGNQTLGVI